MKEGDEAAKEESKSPEGEGEFSQIFEVARGAESLAVRQEVALVVVTGEGWAGAVLSLEAIELGGRGGGERAAPQSAVRAAQVTPSLLVLTVEALLLALSPHL